jgi:hypothetical protein
MEQSVAAAGELGTSKSKEGRESRARRGGESAEKPKTLMVSHGGTGAQRGFFRTAKGGNGWCKAAMAGNG